MKSIAVAAIGVLLAACAPSAVNLSNATDDELDRAYSALSRVGYDYYKLGVVGGRILEVAASIHNDHTGPEKTREYCEGR